MSKIKIRTISHKDNAIILFSDNGRGIPNINELFSRTLDYGNYYNVPTAGTGLYVIKKIAEDHGGTIFAQPSSDGGLTLGIVIPKSPPQNIFKSPEEYPLHETMFSTLAIELSDVIREFKSSIL